MLAVKYRVVSRDGLSPSGRRLSSAVIPAESGSGGVARACFQGGFFSKYRGRIVDRTGASSFSHIFLLRQPRVDGANKKTLGNLRKPRKRTTCFLLVFLFLFLLVRGYISLPFLACP